MNQTLVAQAFSLWRLFKLFIMKNDFDEEGYLGEQISEFRQEILLEFDKLFSCARDFNRLAQKEKINFPFGNNQQHALIATIFCRVLNSYQSVLILLSFGLTSEAEVVLRSLMEATFSLCACSIDDNFYTEYINSFHAQRLRFAKNVHSKNFSELLMTNIPHSELKKLKEKCEEMGAREIKVKELAERSKMEYYYYGPYWDLSLSSHISPKSTECYLNIKDNDFYIELLPKHDPKRFKVLIIIAVDMLIRSLKAFYDFFGYNEPEILSTMFNDWKILLHEDE